jgi:RNA polymerase sigma factor (sigma-70 family)
LLYQRHHRALYRYCRSVVRDEDDAQDALQSAMMRALAALQAGERDLAVRPWLFRIVHNEAVSMLRRRRLNVSLVEDLEPADGGVERTLEERERFAQLLADLRSLAERQRAALVMRELSGLSIEEIAAALSISPGAAKQTLFEARCALHECAEGRAMECEAVRRGISDGDRRVLRGRKISAHLRACRGCRDFQLMIGTRTAELRALAPPLPAAAATAMLARLLADGAGGHAGGAVGAAGATLSNHAATSLTVKALAGVAIVTAATAGTVHLASGSHSHEPAPPPARRSIPLFTGAGGKDVGVHSGARSSITRPARSGLKTFHAGTPTAGQPRLAAHKPRGGTPVPIGVQPAAPLPSQATGGGKASGRDSPGGGPGKHFEHRRSRSTQSPRPSQGRHPSKQIHHTPSRQAAKGRDGQIPASADERPSGHQMPNAASQTRSGNEGHPSSATKAPTR